MKVILFFSFLILMAFVSFAQNSNQAKTDIKGNNNIVTIVQGGKIISYNLSLSNDSDKLLKYLNSIPSIKKSLSQINSSTYQTLAIVKRIDDRIKETEISSIDNFAKTLEKYISENEKLKVELLKIKSENNENDFITILENAELCLKNYDNDGYQNNLNIYIEKTEQKQLNISKKLGEAYYLKAKNNFSSFKTEDALIQINKAINYSKKINYVLLKSDILEDIGKFDECIALLKNTDTTDIDKNFQGTYYSHLGFLFGVVGQFKEAIHFAKKSIVFAKDSVDLGSFYDNLGVMYHKYEQNEKAIIYCEKALKILLKISKNKQFDEDIAICYNNLASIYLRNNKSDDRIISYLSKSKAINLANYNKNDNSELARNLNNIGMYYLEINKIDSSLHYLEESYSMRVRIFGENNLYTAITLLNLANVYRDFDIKKSIIFYRKCLKVYRSLFPQENNPDFINIYEGIANYYSYNGDFQSALNYANISNDYYSKIYGRNGLNTKNKYGDIYNVTMSEIAFRYKDEPSVNPDSLFKEFDIYDFKIQSKSGKDNSNKETIQIFLLNIANKDTLLYKQWKHLNKINELNKLGVDLFKKAEYNEAITKYKEALNLVISKAILNEFWLPIIYQNLAKAYCFNLNKTEAVKLFNEALRYSNNLPELPSLNERIIKNMDECKNK